MTNIRTLARLAGVHRSTVSRVLSGKGYASLESRKKVMAAVKKTNYHVNTMARALKSKHKTALGFFSFWQYSVNPSEIYYQQTLVGVINGITKSQYHLLLNNVNGLLTEDNKELDFFYDSQLAGVVLVAPRAKRESLLFLKKINIPVILLFFRSDSKNISWVDMDNIKGTQLAVDHLIDLGHKRIAYIGGEIEYSSDAMDRYNGYQKALKEAGIKEKPEFVQHGIFAYEHGLEAAQNLLSLPERQRPTAIVCATDMIAFGAMQKAEDMGISIPKQLSIVGFDDYEQASRCNPPLTTIHQPFYDFGRIAVETLESIVKDPKHKAQQVLLEPKLIVRKSTASPAEE